MTTTLSIKAVNPGDSVYIPELSSAPWISKQSYTVLTANTELSGFPSYGEFVEFVFSIQKYLAPKERPIMFKVVVDGGGLIFSATVDRDGWSISFTDINGSRFQHNVTVK